MFKLDLIGMRQIFFHKFFTPVIIKINYFFIKIHPAMYPVMWGKDLSQTGWIQLQTKCKSHLEKSVEKRCP